ncbi:uncharacterized protein MICPUCDRAFT_61408 [Micromonas pusilla CCMP1545]|uniref:Predicted protein n=1 Tax=Micromonas pusilla (strain CCMP1545) TaxID=564608 RepID=C1MHP6_MICPC|nr:uncharacterized protein MICPUCDRAFT_61408 [Micromonas pusilla CCMP1545]EEH60781.1 predicted protein [Micromonas pusilla CCMP1545]|eukprot:XP_003055529.1 predicted protein [Micromonas pusilla CCMP1545]
MSRMITFTPLNSSPRRRGRARFVLFSSRTGNPSGSWFGHLTSLYGLAALPAPRLVSLRMPFGIGLREVVASATSLSCLSCSPEPPPEPPTASSSPWTVIRVRYSRSSSSPKAIARSLRVAVARLDLSRALCFVLASLSNTRALPFARRAVVCRAGPRWN